nr:lysozyme-like protein [uncultured Mediterranean phage uvMED]
MPKIPTFTSQARPTAQVGSVKSNLQIPLSQTVAGALSPVTDFVVKKAVQANDTQNRTEALRLGNEFTRELQTVEDYIANDSVLGVNKEAANAYYKEQTNSLISQFKGQSTNSASQTLFENNALTAVNRGIFRIDNTVEKNVFTDLQNQVTEAETTLITQALYNNNNKNNALLGSADFQGVNVFDYSTLQTNLTKLYTDAFTGKIPAPKLDKMINNIPALVQGFQANKDIGDNPRLAFLELEKGKESALYPNLNLEQREKLIQQADRILTDQLRTQWKNVLAGSAVGKKVQFDMELAKKVLPQIEVNQMLQGKEIITTTADNKKIIFTSNSKDISTLVEQYSEQAVLQAGEAKGQIIAQEYQKAAETRVKAIEDDSAAYVYSHYPELVELNEEFNNETDNELKTQLKRQITTKMLEIQTELGVPTTQQRVMTKSEAENFVANYQKTAQGNATQSQILLQSITTNFGDNDSKALQELQAAGLPITASLAMTVFTPLEAQKAFGLDSEEEQKNLKSWGASNEMTLADVKKSIAANSDFLELETIIRRNNNIDSSVASQQVEEIKNVLAFYAINERFTNAKFDNDSAIESAVNAFTSKFEIEETYFIPRNYDGKPLTSYGTTVNSVRDKADLIKQEYIEEFGAVAFKSTDPFNQGITEEEMSEKHKRMMRTSGEWRNTADGNGLVFGIVLDGDQFAPILNNNNQQLSFNFNDGSYNLPGTNIVMDINKLRVKEVPSEAEIAAIKGYGGFTVDEKELAMSFANKKTTLKNEEIVNTWGTTYQTTNNPKKNARALKAISDTYNIPTEAQNSIQSIVPIFVGDKGFTSQELTELANAIGQIESGYKTKVQIGGGPARSYWQVEPTTALDLLNNSSAIFGPKFENFFSIKYGTNAVKFLASKSKKEMSQLLESDSDLAVAMALGVIVNRKK